MRGKILLPVVAVAVIAIFIGSVSAGAIMVGNVYGVSISPALPPVHMDVSNLPNVYSQMNQYHSSDNATASVESSHDVNISSFAVIKDDSEDNASFSMHYLSSTGTSNVESVTVYAILSNGTYEVLMNMTSDNGSLSVTYSHNVTVPPGQYFSIGENISLSTLNSISASLNFQIVTWESHGIEYSGSEYFLSTTTETSQFY